MNYNETISYILDIPKFTTKNPLQHTKYFLEYLGNPQHQFKAIHVAGTNGKGSVCAYLQALLLTEKKNVGMFISPHLVKLNERIRIHGVELPDDEFLECFQIVKNTVDKMENDGFVHPTFFEFLFGMAMVSFSRHQVEYIILETGLGGRLDATNIIEKPLLTIITSISLDHTGILGDTIAQIAGEKAGIIKKQVPLIFDANEAMSREVIRQRAKEFEAPCREITNRAYEITEITDKHIAFSCVNAYYKHTTWKLENIGIYQVNNAMLALEAIQRIMVEHKNPNLQAWKEALEDVYWEGRMEEIIPNVYVDGAHNIGAIQSFVESLCSRNSYGKRKIVILFAVVTEKKYDEMIAYLCEHAQIDTFVITEVADDRAAKAGEIATRFGKYTRQKLVVEKNLEKAWEIALREKGPEGELYCLGSLYLVGMIKELIGRNSNA